MRSFLTTTIIQVDIDVIEEGFIISESFVRSIRIFILSMKIENQMTKSVSL